MSPRPYRLDRRQVAINETRARILAAARELLLVGDDPSGFTIDAVARQAGVARMTVYYQFGSKAGLLEGLFDELAMRGRIDRMGEALARPDAAEALAQFVTVLGGFWASDRVVIRRLRGLAALDAEIGAGVRARDERRRGGTRMIVRRLADERGRPRPDAVDEAVNLLYTLASFETFDNLAGTERTIEEVTPVVQRLVRLALGLDDA